DHWHQPSHPLITDYTHILNVAGLVQLPHHFYLGLNFSYSSAPPFSPFVGGIDFNGDGTIGDLLPGASLANLIADWSAQTWSVSSTSSTRNTLSRQIPITVLFRSLRCRPVMLWTTGFKRLICV